MNPVDPTKKRSQFYKLLSLLWNPFFWSRLFKLIRRLLFPNRSANVIHLNLPALDVDLVGLDGTEYKLVKDFVNKTDIPLILNIGSYN